MHGSTDRIMPNVLASLVILGPNASQRGWRDRAVIFWRGLPPITGSSPTNEICGHSR